MKTHRLYSSLRLLIWVCLNYVFVVIFPNAAFGRTYAVVIGHNIGHRNEDSLKFAEQDAKRFWELVTTLGGVDEEDAFLIIAPTKERVDETLRRLDTQLRSQNDEGQYATVLLFFAGHGDQKTLHLAQENLERDKLIEALEALPARVVLAILDACQTPSVSQQRGVRSGASFAVDISNRSSSEGTVIIQSSQIGQPALESEALGGSLFSHYWLSGLRGAADFDRDGEVTLHEAYLFTSRHTLLYSSSTSQVVQHPSFDIDLKGSNDLVLTRLNKASAKLVLVDDREARYLIFQQPSGAFVAEVYPLPNRSLDVAVPKGRLLIQRRVGDELQVAQVEISFGGRYSLSPDEIPDDSEIFCDEQGIALTFESFGTIRVIKGGEICGTRQGEGVVGRSSIDPTQPVPEAWPCEISE